MAIGMNDDDANQPVDSEQVESEQGMLPEILAGNPSIDVAPYSTEPPRDLRLYIPNTEGVKLHAKVDASKEYCFYKNPGENYFHLLVMGEMYLEVGHERICLTCAYRHGMITDDRIFWQHPRWRKR
jgi:hypothetical protein